ncbi:MAG: 4-hydroxy-tetrahydrodipicolinate reductase, partial [Planctomycetota bacterium]
GYALVSGRTGLSADDEKALRAAAKTVAVLHSRNLSVGANLLAGLSAQAAVRMPSAHLEIVETHHARKADAPSGTALMILEALQQARKGSMPVYGREGQSLRQSSEIGVHAIRGGDVVGDHTVHLMMDGERIEITHRASDRRIFARGGLAAARFVSEQPPGFYTMADLLGY